MQRLTLIKTTRRRSPLNWWQILAFLLLGIVIGLAASSIWS